MLFPVIRAEGLIHAECTPDHYTYTKSNLIHTRKQQDLRTSAKYQRFELATASPSSLLFYICTQAYAVIVYVLNLIWYYLKKDLA